MFEIFNLTEQFKLKKNIIGNRKSAALAFLTPWPPYPCQCYFVCHVCAIQIQNLARPEEERFVVILYVATSPCYLVVVSVYRNPHFLSNEVENYSRMLFIKFYICASAPFFNFAIAFSSRALNGARFHIPPNSS